MTFSFFSSDYNPHTDRSTFYNPEQCTWRQVRPRQTLLIFGTMRMLKILFLRFFWKILKIRNFSMSPNGRSFIFLHMTKSMCIAVQLSKFFFHYSQLHNERLLEKSQNPREIRTCSLPIARNKCWPLCHRDLIEQSWTVEYIRYACDWIYTHSYINY